jgi:O-acetyl-ADP-ribose deacetylase (regulator of RNase III)
MEMETRIKIILGDITQQKVDAIINAANNSLLGGGGVDGAIHNAAGPGLLEECRTLNGCQTGQAKITKGYNLPARHVIHTVGPVWYGGSKNEKELLESCYRNCLELASKENLRNIAFPSISTGIYGYPIELAARIALTEIMRFLKQHPTIENITIVCFGNRAYNLYNQIYNELNNY